MAHKISYQPGSVPLNRVCYDYRDDIAFRIYVMMSNDWDSMKKWKRLKHSRKSERHGSYKPKYLQDLLQLVKDTPVGDTKFAWKKVPKKGKILDRVHFAFDKKTDIYYPAGGGSRVAIAYFLCHSHVPALLVSTKEGSAWAKNFGVGTRHFNGMPDDIIKKMLFRREINNLFVDGILKKKISSEFLYKIPDLGFRGKFDVNNLLNDKELLTQIRGKEVLNTIQDNGYLEVSISEYCSSVTTVGESSHRIKISNKISNYYKKSNIKHIKNVLSYSEYDVILSKGKNGKVSLDNCKKV